MKKLIVGVDVSKEKLDFCLKSQIKIEKEFIVVNQSALIKESLCQILQELKVQIEDLLICAEYTGQYTYPLCCACQELGIDLWLENPSQIKYRSGVQRGKNDKMDARKIADYAKRFEDEAKLFSMPQKCLASLKQLISERDMYVCDRSKYQGQLTDQKCFMDVDDYKKKSRRLKSLIKDLDTLIVQIENDMQKIIDNDQTLSNQHKLLCSIGWYRRKNSRKNDCRDKCISGFYYSSQILLPCRYCSFCLYLWK